MLLLYFRLDFSSRTHLGLRLAQAKAVQEKRRSQSPMIARRLPDAPAAKASPDAEWKLGQSRRSVKQQKKKETSSSSSSSSDSSEHDETTARQKML